MKPPDANDIHRLHGIDALRECLDHGRWSFEERDANPEPVLDLAAWRSGRFRGDPPPVPRLVENSIPRGVPCLIAAQGDTGKTTLLLELGRRVAFGQEPGASPIFGGNVVDEGTVVLLVAEDGLGPIHRRLSALDPDGARLSKRGDRLIIVPLPDAGGPQPLFRQTGDELVETDFYHRLRDQLSAIPDLALVGLDPLQAFVHARINEDPGAGQFVCSKLAALAASTKATVLVPHHMRKGSAGTPITTLAAAREAVRGTSALIDGVRFAYALWPMEENEAKRVCRQLGVPFAPNKVYSGGVIKANEFASRSIATYVRNEVGLLVDHTEHLIESAPMHSDPQTSLTEAVRLAALRGQPFTKTGKNGLYEQRSRLPAELRDLGKHRIVEVADQALKLKLIVQAMARGSKSVQWLDVPNGPFAQGQGEFKHGATG